ncbi:Serine/threonine-protein kinase wnk3 [Nowakowskiella sp. JEL0407]|nr:Serine/threonine-protein kinase wnk3 [Nowakowskiella sp. JEL0407]
MASPNQSPSLSSTYKSQTTGLPEHSEEDEDDEQKVVETDPTGRFERYAKCIGRGAYKEVFKAFDNEEGVEVAWNQLKLDHLSKKEFARTLSEIEILQSLRNEHIINIYHSWEARGPDSKDRIYFITELMTSGTLKSYIRKTKGPIRLKVLKNWCRQILLGLDYLHSRDPPIIHRDLKCENIFVNGNNGVAKIGDLGLATVKKGDHVSSVLGTPEFMAPEFYDEYYTETVDVYAFGLCVLEMCTKEYPYAECTNQAQIYKKVTQGIKPLALQKVTHPETRKFIEMCIQHDPKLRPRAFDLLRNPYLVNTDASSTDIAAILTTTDPSNMPFPVSQPINLPPNANPTKINTAQSYTESLKSQPPLSAGITQVPEDKNHEEIKRNQSFPSYYGKLSETQTYVDADIHTYQIQDFSQPPLGLTEAKPLCIVDVVDSPVSTSAQDLSSSTHPGMVPTAREVMLRMVYGVSGKSKEIKFPFNIDEDNSADVVAEMVRENLISKEDERVAWKCVEDAVIGVKMRKGMFIDPRLHTGIPPQLLKTPVEEMNDGANSSDSYFSKETITPSDVLIPQKSTSLPRSVSNNSVGFDGLYRSLGNAASQIPQVQRAQSSNNSSVSSVSSYPITPNNSLISAQLSTQQNLTIGENTILTYIPSSNVTNEPDLFIRDEGTTKRYSNSHAAQQYLPASNIDALGQNYSYVTMARGPSGSFVTDVTQPSISPPLKPSTSTPSSQYSSLDRNMGLSHLTHQASIGTVYPTNSDVPLENTGGVNSLQHHPAMQQLMTQQQMEQMQLQHFLQQQQHQQALQQRQSYPPQGGGFQPGPGRASGR